MDEPPPTGSEGEAGPPAPAEAEPPPMPKDAEAAKAELEAAVRDEPSVMVADAAGTAPLDSKLADARPTLTANGTRAQSVDVVPGPFASRGASPGPAGGADDAAAGARTHVGAGGDSGVADARPTLRATGTREPPVDAGTGSGPAVAEAIKPPARPPRPRARKKDDDTRDDDGAERDGPAGRRRWPIVVGGLAALAAGITAIVLAGRANHRRLYLRCGASEITALRGRSVPPWGTERLAGAAWKPVAIPAATECTDRATRDPIELEGWYLDALVTQATAALGADGGDVDRAEAQLQQALLLARSPDRRDQRRDIDRLLADVTYARGAARVKGAIATLRDAAGRFDDAAGRRPRHAADAASWAAFVRAMADRLEGGPKAEPLPSLLPAAPDRERPPAPPGVALPVEPPGGTAPLPPPELDAGVPGIPPGGVLM